MCLGIELAVGPRLLERMIQDGLAWSMACGHCDRWVCWVAVLVTLVCFLL
jgi:hypothetical protein